MTPGRDCHLLNFWCVVCALSPELCSAGVLATRVHPALLTAGIRSLAAFLQREIYWVQF